MGCEFEKQMFLEKQRPGLETWMSPSVCLPQQPHLAGPGHWLETCASKLLARLDHYPI